VSEVEVKFRWDQDGFDVDFFDLSVPPVGVTIVGRLWDFGDGATSTATNPSHTYPTDFGTGVKTYLVTLRITDSNGCKISYQRVILFGPSSCFWVREDGTYEAHTFESSLSVAATATMVNGTTCSNCAVLSGSFMAAWDGSSGTVGAWPVATSNGCSPGRPEKYVHEQCIATRSINVGFGGGNTHRLEFPTSTPIYLGMIYIIPPVTTGSRPCYGSGNATVMFFE
jgi:hypothetical protein